MFKRLFSPLKINELEIPNRLIVGPMVTCYAEEDGKVTEQYIEYVREKAKGHWGLIINEAHAVIESAKAFDKFFGLYNDDQIEGQKRLVEAAHSEGQPIAVQLVHGGRQSLYTKAPIKAPSRVADPTSEFTPEALTIEEIEEIVEGFGDAAVRAKKAGYDAVEIHGAHGYLIQEFTSPYSNKRTDKYGGDLEGRARFPLEIIENIRQKTGPDFPIIYRISTDEYLPHGLGLTIADTLALAMMFEKAGIDALHCSIGNYTTIHYMLPPAAVRHAESAALSEKLKDILDIPVFNVGRYTDPYIAEASLAAGRCDAVVMARQSLADPYFPDKAKAGKIQDIRNCIGCQIGCVEHLYKIEPIQCTMNPRVSFEYEYNKIPEKADKQKKVVVIGGGIGGMEAAIEAAKRGHDVSLYEKTDELGGQWIQTGFPPYKQESTKLIINQEKTLKDLDVKVELNKEMSAEDILALKPDEVILATGAKPLMPQIKGADNDKVLCSADILTGKKVAGANNIVIGGGDVGCETAAFIAMTNKNVRIFEMLDTVAPTMEGSVKLFLLEYLKEKEVPICLNAEVVEITEDGIIYEEDGERKECGPVDNIIIAVGAESYNPLEKELEGKVKTHVIGDARRVQQGIDAVQEGYRIGRTI